MLGVGRTYKIRSAEEGDDVPISDNLATNNRILQSADLREQWG